MCVWQLHRPVRRRCQNSLVLPRAPASQPHHSLHPPPPPSPPSAFLPCSGEFMELSKAARFPLLSADVYQEVYTGRI